MEKAYDLGLPFGENIPETGENMRITLVLAALSLALLALLPSAASAQTDDGTSVDVAILDVLRARGLIDQALYEELLAMARSRVDRERGEIDLIQGRLERLRAPDLQSEGGTPGKLKWKSSDGKWSLNLKGRIQTRVEYLDSEDSTKDGTNFSVARGRIGIEGIAGAENVSYKLEVDYSTRKTLTDPSTEPSPTVRHAWVNWGFENGVNLTTGQFKFPFGREALTSSGNISLAERSIASVEFAPEYEPGAMLFGTANNGVWEWYGAVSNGEGRGKGNTSGEEKNGLRQGVRVVWNPYGPMKLDGPSFQTLDDDSTKLSFAAAYMTNRDSSGLAAATVGSDTSTLGLEASAMHGPWSLHGECYSRAGDVDGAPDVDDDGHTVQVGYFIDPDVWELVLRQSEIDFDAKDDMEETVLGVNYYVDKHNGKWMADVSRLNNDGVTADAKRVRLQYQLIF